MKYMLLIQQGDAPTPRDPEAWGRLSQEEQQAIYADYGALNQTPGVTNGGAVYGSGTRSTGGSSSPSRQIGW